MAVVLDATGSADAAGGPSNTFTFTNITVGSGSNRALIAVLSGYDAGNDPDAPGTVTATWDSGGTNQNMPVITGAKYSGFGSSNNIYVVLFGLVAPTSGNKTLSINVPGAGNSIFFYLDAISFTGVDQTGGATSFPHGTSANGNSTAPSVAVTSSSGNYTVACVQSDFTNVSAPTQTSLYVDNSVINGGGGSYATGAATVTHAFTLAAAKIWGMAGTDVAASAGAAPNPWNGSAQVIHM